MIGLALPLLLAIPTTQFLLDSKRRSRTRNQKNQRAVFTRSLSSTLLITTPTLTPSLAKTSLNAELFVAFGKCKLTTTENTIILFVNHSKGRLWFLLGVKIAPRETENNAYAKF